MPKTTKTSSTPNVVNQVLQQELSNFESHSPPDNLLHPLLITHPSWCRTRPPPCRSRPITWATSTTPRLRNPPHNDSPSTCPQRPRLFGLSRPPLGNLTFLLLRNPPLFRLSLLVPNAIDPSIVFIWIVGIVSDDFGWLPPELCELWITRTG